MKTLSFLCLSLCVLPTLFAQKADLLEAVAQAEQEGYSGIVLVADRGEVLFEKAIGMQDFEKNIPLEPTAIFELASVSKQFTAMMVMRCAERGLLHLDDAVEDFLAIPYTGIRIRHLLTHTSGLPDYQAIMDAHWDKSKAAGNAEIVAYLRRYTPAKRFEPGERYEYSNTGYVLLASIVEKVTGRDFVELSKEWIFDPLGMKNTAIRSLEEKALLPNVALGHLLDESGNPVHASRFRSSDYTFWLGKRKGPGRVSSTVKDLLIWDQALYQHQLIRPETLAEAFKPARLADGTRSYYGFGWEIDPKSIFGKLVFHTGSNPGYQTIILRFVEENKTVIILNNNAHPAHKNLIQAATQSLRNW